MSRPELRELHDLLGEFCLKLSGILLVDPGRISDEHVSEIDASQVPEPLASILTLLRAKKVSEVKLLLRIAIQGPGDARELTRAVSSAFAWNASWYAVQVCKLISERQRYEVALLRCIRRTEKIGRWAGS